MDLASRSFTSLETKIFDPADGFGPVSNLVEITDATIGRRGDQWWMYAAGQIGNHDSVWLFSASLPGNAPLSATGWRLTADPLDSTKIALLAGNEASKSWDLNGGRHCPSWLSGEGIERIYYAGAAENLWGPYTIGYLEWDGARWVDQPAPVFTASEEWERGSVCEPNVIYEDGKWKMWYVAGSNRDDYVVQGYAESPDGRANWSRHRIFAPADHKMLDFCPVKTKDGYEAVFSRVWLGNTPPPSETGLWWCRADRLSGDLRDWSEPVQILTAENKGWRTAPWKPSLRYDPANPDRLFVFFDGIYSTGDFSQFSFAFTMGCLEILAAD